MEKKILKTSLLLLFLVFGITNVIKGQTANYKIEVNDLRYEFTAGIWDSTTDSYVTVEIVYEDGSTKNVYYAQVNDQDQDVWDWDLNPPIISSSRPISVKVYARINFRAGTDANFGDNKSINLCSINDYTIYSNTPGRMSNITFKVKITPIVTINSLQTDGTVCTFLPSDNKININAPTGFPTDIYNWEYSQDGLLWNNLPANLNSYGKSTINVSLTDIIGANVSGSVGNNTYFRLRACSGVYSNVVTLNNRLSSPKIVAVEPINNKCFGDNQGSVKLTFDRQLLQNETLSLSLVETSNSSYTGSRDNLTAFDAGNTITWNGELPPGAYKLDMIGKYPNSSIPTFTDGPDHTATFRITEPTAVSFSATSSNVNCNCGTDGTIAVTASGGVGNYKVLYKKNDETNYTTQAFSSATSHTISGLTKGDYNIRVLDGNDCVMKTNGVEVIKSVTISEPTAPLAIDFKQGIDPTAFGFTNGSATAIVVGGTPLGGNSYAITWTDENGTALSTVANTQNPFTSKLSQLGKGRYIITATDANYSVATGTNSKGCIIRDTIDLNEPALLTVQTVINNTIPCYGMNTGEIVAKARGGIQLPNVLYKYEWFKNTNGTWTSINQTDSVATELLAGVYKVKITDANNISVESTPITITQPDPLQFTATSTAVHCNCGVDGTIVINATGGSGTYKVRYKKTTDVDFTEVSFSASLTHTISGLTSGAYQLQVIDVNGCVMEENGTVTIKSVSITEPSAPVAIQAKSSFNPTAFGYTDGWAAVTVTGGTPVNGNSYTVTWTDSLNNVLQSVTNTLSPFTSKLQNVGNGKYYVTITDANYALTTGNNAKGCIIRDTIELKQPLPLKVEISETHVVTCNGMTDGQLYAKASGGIEIPAKRYQYDWFKNDGSNWIALGQTDSVATNLPSGTYKIRITDANNIIKGSVPFVLVQPEPLKIALSSTPIICSGSSIGTAKAIISGGTTPYELEWSTGETITEISNLAKGKYFAFVKDARGCQTQGVVEVLSPNEIIVQDTILKHPTCNNACDGNIALTVVGGFAPYTYAWSNGATTASINGVCAGAYSVIITDAKGCFIKEQFTLNNPLPIVIDLGPDKTLCNEQTLTVNARIADDFARYSWSGPNGFNASTPDVTLSEAGTYRVTVTNSKGCQGSDEITISRTSQVIAAEYVASTQAFTTDPVAFVNISKPDPEHVEWIIPNDPTISVLDKTDKLLTLQFSAVGEYHIGLNSTVGACEKLFIQPIKILKKEVTDNPGSVTDPFIREFTVGPNPNNGSFTVNVTLQQAGAINLKLLNVQTGLAADVKQFLGKSSYSIPYSLNLSTGVYVLLLETAKENRVFRIIIY